MLIDENKRNKLEEQIDAEQRAVSYDIREFTIEYYVDKYTKDIENDNNELYIPDYQREFIWDNKRQSRFIESLFLGLPVPLIFVAEIEKDGRLEIVDGSQRIRTLSAFLNNELTLEKLEKLTELNSLQYQNLPQARQRKFKNLSMRMIVLSSKATESIRNEMFDRINTSSVPLLPMETRRGIYKGKFTDFITKLSEDSLFTKLCRINDYFKDRREEEELVLRFFAFSEGYPTFKLYGKNLEKDGVAKFLDNYLNEKNNTTNSEEMKKLQDDFTKMLLFIDKTFPNQGFSKRINGVGVSRIYFEAIAIGANLALNETENLSVADISWSTLDKNNPNDFFKILSGKYHTHKPTKLKSRIEYVKNQFLSLSEK